MASMALPMVSSAENTANFELCRVYSKKNSLAYICEKARVKKLQNTGGGLWW